ncbi:MAG: protoheme IX farnesyltransferase [Chitinophagaceae bacterium]|nr:protoheme IX farnesyltransferase [Chitinophagaceae bacterium]MBK7559111.1 protoheme IX farnesyltransferase [Chitinophagaceae bacterium]MBK9533191.1 protoheme IX farnesyltransferase [Chitinophagaceae bacterium]
MNNSEQDKITIAGSTSYSLASKVKDYFQLIKFTLSFMVVFSTVVSFLIAPNEQFYVREKIISVLLLFVAGMLITGSANAINQVLEKSSDSLMKRTAQRPVASGRMGVTEAGIFAFITGAAGVFMMWNYFNTTSAMVSLFSLFLYGFIYTPLKKVNSISVLVGAIPGALPCLIGWVAAYGNETISWTGAWVLFGIQFLWQFPHFWAIAWLAHKDYETAGFKLLPADKGPTRFTAMQSIIYSAMMIPVGFLPYFTGVTGKGTSGIICMAVLFICNLWMVYVSVLLFKNMNAKSARRVMFSSYFYLMVVLLALFIARA